MFRLAASATDHTFQSFAAQPKNTVARRSTLRTVVRNGQLLFAGLLCFAAGAVILSPTVARAEDRHVERRVPPVYPEIAKRMRVSGTVHLTVTIAPDGSVVKALAVTGNKMLAPAAEEAVKQWKFSAASEETSTVVDVNFQQN